MRVENCGDEDKEVIAYIRDSIAVILLKFLPVADVEVSRNMLGEGEP